MLPTTLRRPVSTTVPSDWRLAPNTLLFLLLLILVTVGVIAFAAWQWRRRRVTGRIMLVVLSQVLVMLSVLTYINRADDLITTWSSLVGSTAGQSPAVVSRSAGTGVFGTRAPNSWKLTPAQRQVDMSTAANSTLRSITIGGGATGYNLNAQVYLPGSYNDSQSAARKFPVLELLAGFPGSYLSWSTGIQLKQTLDELIAQGKMPAVIAVMPSQNPHPPDNSECLNGNRAAHPDSRAETYLTGDVPAYLAQHYRTGQGRINWVIGGYSTGGYCATNLALRHPDRYASVIALSGYFTAIHSGNTQPLFQDRQRRAANSPQLTVTQPHPKLAFFTINAKDNLLDALSNQKFINAIPAADAHLAMTTQSGGHTPLVWRVGSRYAFIWLAQLLSK